MFFARFFLVLNVAVCFVATAVLAEQHEVHQIRSLEQGEPVQRLETSGTTPCVDGMAGVYPCHKIDLMAHLPLANIGGGKDCSDL